MDCIEVSLLGIMLMHRPDDRVAHCQLVVATVVSCTNPTLIQYLEISILPILLPDSGLYLLMSTIRIQY